MGFSSVYGLLLEIFPQVDTRVLKAAAFEHSDDPEASVEFILSKFLPYADAPNPYAACCSLIAESRQRLSPVENGRHRAPEFDISSFANSSIHASTSLAGEAADGSGEMNEPYHMGRGGLSDAVYAYYDAKDIDNHLIRNTGKAAIRNGVMSETVSTFCSRRTCLNETVGSSLDTTICDVKDTDDQLSGNTRTKELTSSHFCDEAGDTDGNLESENNGVEDSTPVIRDFELHDVGFSSSLSSIALDNAVPEVCLNGKQHTSSDSHCISLSEGLKGSVLVDDQKNCSTFGSDLLYGSKYGFKLSSDCPIQSEVHRSVSASNHKITEPNGIADGALREDVQAPSSADIEESSSVHTVLTRSGQLCRTDLLEDIIEDAKSHKKILLSSMEAVLKLMKEVELEEKIAQQAKEEAAKAGSEIVAKVEELKRMLSHARDANDMHSGEVYGERAILTTEMRELQSRLLVLSDEKENSLSILSDTMRQALETRLAAAEADRMAAEQEKHEKEQIAQRDLAEQELIMEKVVQESKILQHEAEENAKLREFLADRGDVVDTLQGEISVICEDVKLLKEKYDNSVPLSECFSPKQTSCILASSGSSLKSTRSEQVLEQQQAKWPSTSSLNDSFLIPSVELASELDPNPLEEGWELF